jgi:HME family heavy-metal exporter
VTIFSEAGGLAPEEVEALVTFPIESAMNGAASVQRVRSVSSVGLSIVFVEFGFNQDIYIARQIVTERLQQVSEQLPPTIKPVLTPITSIMGEIMLVGVTSDNPDVTPMDLRTIADWQIRQRLLSVPGISQIAVIGGELKQYQVLVDPFKLRNFNISLHDVEEATKNANVNSTGGFILRPHTEQLVRNLARVKDIEDLKKSVIPSERNGGIALTLGPGR